MSRNAGSTIVFLFIYLFIIIIITYSENFVLLTLKEDPLEI